MADVCAALSFCHWQGVAHGDVKPENMVRGGDGAVRLIDFSVSQLLGDGGDAAGETPCASTPPSARSSGSELADGASLLPEGAPLLSNDVLRTPGALYLAAYHMHVASAARDRVRNAYLASCQARLHTPPRSAATAAPSPALRLTCGASRSA